jgi:hypothetical protein
MTSAPYYSDVGYLGQSDSPTGKERHSPRYVAAAGPVISSTVPLARDALTSPLAIGIARRFCFSSSPEDTVGGSGFGCGRPLKSALSF